MTRSTRDWDDCAGPEGIGGMRNRLNQLRICDRQHRGTAELSDGPDQTRSVPSSPEEMAPLPSGNATTEYTKEVWPDRLRSGAGLSKE